MQNYRDPEVLFLLILSSSSRPGLLVSPSPSLDWCPGLCCDWWNSDYRVIGDLLCTFQCIQQHRYKRIWRRRLHSFQLTILLVFIIIINLPVHYIDTNFLISAISHDFMRPSDYVFRLVCPRKLLCFRCLYCIPRYV